MAKYRKIPVVIEAEQWFPGKKIDGVMMAEKVNGEWIYPPGFPEYYEEENGNKVKRNPNWGWIRTLEGGNVVSPGDYVITGVDGEKYPCKPDIFEKTYEKVGE